MQLRIIGLTVAALCVVTTAQAVCETTLGPSSKREALLGQPHEIYTFIVRGATGQVAQVQRQHVARAELPHPVPLASIQSVAISLKVSDVALMCDSQSFDQFWYLAPGLDAAYVRILSAIDQAVRTLDPPSVINLSLGPPMDFLPMAGDLSEPMHRMTRAAADKGLLAVFAIGNKPDLGDSPGPNPWCYAEWVICVGAAHAGATRLWSGSVEGTPEDEGTWPDVVANGVDVISLWPTNLVKSEARRKRDESDPRFQSSIPKENWNLYTIESGTSQAAAHVTRAAAQIIHFVHALTQDKKLGPRDLLFSLELPKDRALRIPRGGKRLAGEVVKDTDSGSNVAYRLVEPWKLVKQLLIDTAVPMPAYKPSQVGAGFVDPNYVSEQFGSYGRVNVQIMPIKAFP